MENISIVMVATSHPGNIGAAARAMKTMGLGGLCLVAPERFPHRDANAMALLSLVQIWAAAHYLLAARHLRGDLARARSGQV